MAGARTESREIGGHTYTVTQMPPSRALPLQLKLAKILLPVLPVFATMASEGPDKVLAQAAGALAKSISEHLSPEEFLAMAKSLTQGDSQASFVTVDEGPLIFEQQFMGDSLVDLYLVIAFVLEVNYASFFGALFQNPLMAVPAAASSGAN